MSFCCFLSHMNFIISLIIVLNVPQPPSLFLSFKFILIIFLFMETMFLYMLLRMLKSFLHFILVPG